MIRLIRLDVQPRFSSIIHTRIQCPYFVHGILAKNNHLLAECHTVSPYVQSLKSFSYLYQKWVDQITSAQPVQNISQENIALRDITLTYIAVDLKSCHILNIWWVEVQVGTWQAIHHGFASRKDLNGIAAIPLRIVLLLTVRSDQKAYSITIPSLLHIPIHRLLRFMVIKVNHLLI